MLDAVIDENDPAYDSADELFEAAFGSNSRNTPYDWSSISDLAYEDDCAMDEIEEAVREDWMERAQIEQVEVEDEGEAFFAQKH